MVYNSKIWDNDSTLINLVNKQRAKFAPPNGSEFHVRLAIRPYKSTNPVIYINDFNYSKDTSDITSSGTFITDYSKTKWKALKKWTKLLIQCSWVKPGGKIEWVDYDTVYVKDINSQRTNIEITFVGEGILLEHEADAGINLKGYNVKNAAEIIIAKAGLIPDVHLPKWLSKVKLDFNPILETEAQEESSEDQLNTSNSSSSSNSNTDDVVSGRWKPTCSYHCGSWKYYSRSWKNYCPLCGASGKLDGNNPKNADGGEITCTECDADYCGNCGRDKDGGGSRGRLTKANAVSNTNNTNTSTNSNTPSVSKSLKTNYGPVTGAGYPATNDKNKVYEYRIYKSTAKNKCPVCGKKGHMVWIRGKNNAKKYGKKISSALYKKGIFICSKQSGGCNSQFSIDGNNVNPKKKSKKLTLLSPPVFYPKTINLGLPSDYSPDTLVVTSQGKYSSDSDANSWYDALYATILQRNFKEVLVDVRLGVCSITEPPDRKTVKCLADDQINIKKEGITLKEPEPRTVNTIVVFYGSKNKPKKFKARLEEEVSKYGEIRGANIYKYKYNSVAARHLAFEELYKNVLDNGFQIEVTCIGNHYFYTGEWSAVKHVGMNIHTNMFINSLNLKYTVGEVPTIDLVLDRYMNIAQVANENDNGEDNPGSTSGFTTAKALGKALKTPHECFMWVKNNISYSYYYDHKTGREPDNLVKNPQPANCYDQAGLLIALLQGAGYNSSRRCGVTCGTTRHCDVRVTINGKVKYADTSCPKRGLTL